MISGKIRLDLRGTRSAPALLNRVRNLLAGCANGDVVELVVDRHVSPHELVAHLPTDLRFIVSADDGYTLHEWLGVLRKGADL
ncbi:hypothetical protein [uncultured Microbacterium sp.]|uniref:Uncharacterized protein n=1 Tax=uncultured Microbacterium sp. TaxID=191216 RepID=A0A1Y5P3V4_9MICO|nr:hypothetical protein [uncultured Microbacterium sp.]SBS70791.1 hypothetical protein MIPYR_10653 [uncultured Microbacterium sp.]